MTERGRRIGEEFAETEAEMEALNAALARQGGTVLLPYTTTVYVTVDLERELVVSVRVSDVETRLDYDHVRGIRRREAAARIAEEADWPEWEVGE